MDKIILKLFKDSNIYIKKLTSINGNDSYSLYKIYGKIKNINTFFDEENKMYMKIDDRKKLYVGDLLNAYDVGDEEKISIGIIDYVSYNNSSGFLLHIKNKNG